MSTDSASFNLSPAGYLIVERAESARCSNDYRKEFGEYCGVDRLPLLIAPDPVIRHSLQEPPVTDVRVGEAIEEWLDLVDSQPTPFLPSPNQALRLLSSLESIGLQLELLYCEIAWHAGEEERTRAFPTDEVEGKPPAISLTYGFDVSWPSCTHSAILQPGVVLTSPTWRHKLNEYGLLSDYTDAASLRTEYLAVYPYPPFDIYVVHKVG